MALSSGHGWVPISSSACALPLRCSHVQFLWRCFGVSASVNEKSASKWTSAIVSTPSTTSSAPKLWSIISFLTRGSCSTANSRRKRSCSPVLPTTKLLNDPLQVSQLSNRLCSWWVRCQSLDIHQRSPASIFRHLDLRFSARSTLILFLLLILSRASRHPRTLVSYPHALSLCFI